MTVWEKGDSDVIAEHIAEQFATNWLLVIENDRDCWTQLIDDAKSMDLNVISFAAYLREEWDVLIDQMETQVSKISDVACLLLRQMLVMGDRPFELIARHVIERIKEEK